MTYKILVAEDDSVLREVYSRKFAGEEYEVTATPNGEEALAHIAQEKPDVLLLDLNMPIMDGFAVLEKLPSKHERGFPVIILTNFEDQQNRRRGEELGVDDYFVKKEMTIKSLYKMVNDLLDGKK